eukprot:g25135.t1
MPHPSSTPRSSGTSIARFTFQVLLRDVDFIRPRHELQTYSFPVERRELPVLQDPVQAIQHQLAQLDCPAQKGWKVTDREGAEILCRCGGGSHELRMQEVLTVLDDLNVHFSAFVRVHRSQWHGEGVNDFIAHYLEQEMKQVLEDQRAEHARERRRREDDAERSYQQLAARDFRREQSETCSDFTRRTEEAHPVAEEIYVKLCHTLVRRLPFEDLRVLRDHDLSRLESGEATAPEAQRESWYKELDSWKRNESEEEEELYQNILKLRPDLAHAEIEGFLLQIQESYPDPDVYQGRLECLKDTYEQLLDDYTRAPIFPSMASVRAGRGLLLSLALLCAPLCFVGPQSAPVPRTTVILEAAASGTPPAAAPASGGSSVALVKVTKENTIATAGVLGGVTGLLLGGFWIGAAGFVATSYLAKKEDDPLLEVSNKVGTAVNEALDSNQGETTTTVKDALGTVNGAIDSFDKDVVELNTEYKVTDQLKAKIDEALASSKSSLRFGGDRTAALEKVTEALTQGTSEEGPLLEGTRFEHHWISQDGKGQYRLGEAPAGRLTFHSVLCFPAWTCDRGHATRFEGVPFETVNVLDEANNPGVREAVKEFGQWPTIPQLYVAGQLVGGADIVMEMYQQGELEQMLVMANEGAGATGDAKGKSSSSAEYATGNVKLIDDPNRPTATDLCRALDDKSFALVDLKVVDESAAHEGDAGALEMGLTSESHFSVTIVSPDFASLTRVQRQQKVYEALGGVMPRIHALSLVTRTPEETDDDGQ